MRIVMLFDDKKFLAAVDGGVVEEKVLFPVTCGDINLLSAHLTYSLHDFLLFEKRCDRDARFFRFPPFVGMIGS